MPDIHFNHATPIHLVEALPDSDLVAVSGEHSVEVLRVRNNSCESLALFHLGTTITALAWSPKSSATEDEWVVELAAATMDFALHILTKSDSSSEEIFHFGGGLSGHHGKVTSMAFCGGRSDDSMRYVASVSDDKMLMVWDLNPNAEIYSFGGSFDRDRSPSPSSRKQPTAYCVSFERPLTAVSSHPTSSKEFLVADSGGSIFLVDWRSDPDDHTSLIQLLDPVALANRTLGLGIPSTGSIAWQRDNPDIIAATYGSRFSIWDIGKLHGGKPSASGNSFSEGGHRIRFSPTYPDYFAISTRSPAKGAVIHVHNINHVNAQPTIFSLAPRPHFIRDHAFLGTSGARIAAAVGLRLTIFSIGTE